jgi:hypothetical protein
VSPSNDPETEEIQHVQKVLEEERNFEVEAFYLRQRLEETKSDSEKRVKDVEEKMVRMGFEKEKLEERIESLLAENEALRDKKRRSKELRIEEEEEEREEEQQEDLEFDEGDSESLGDGDDSFLSLERKIAGISNGVVAHSSSNGFGAASSKGKLVKGKGKRDPEVKQLRETVNVLEELVSFYEKEMKIREKEIVNLRTSIEVMEELMNFNPSYQRGDLSGCREQEMKKFMTDSLGNEIELFRRSSMDI